ncbi:MAG: hypothetical protein WCP06_09380 [Verrucomicrobiota bacterium]
MKNSIIETLTARDTLEGISFRIALRDDGTAVVQRKPANGRWTTLYKTTQIAYYHVKQMWHDGEEMLGAIIIGGAYVPNPR